LPVVTGFPAFALVSSLTVHGTRYIFFPGFPLASDNGAFHLYGKTVFPVGKVNRRGFSTENFSDEKNLQKYSSFHIFNGMVGKSLLLPFALSHYPHAS